MQDAFWQRPVAAGGVPLAGPVRAVGRNPSLSQVAGGVRVGSGRPGLRYCLSMGGVGGGGWGPLDVVASVLSASRGVGSGPPALRIGTWSLSAENVARLDRWLDEGRVASLRVLADESWSGSGGHAAAEASGWSGGVLRLGSSHAKWVALSGGDGPGVVLWPSRALSSDSRRVESVLVAWGGAVDCDGWLRLVDRVSAAGGGDGGGSGPEAVRGREAVAGWLDSAPVRLVGSVDPGVSWVGVHNGEWSAGQLLDEVIGRVGALAGVAPAVDVVTFAVSGADAARMVAWVDDGAVSRLRVMGSYGIPKMSPNAWPALVDGLGRGAVRLWAGHAKVAVVSAGPVHVLVSGSANLSRNRRVEDVVVSGDRSLVVWWGSVLDDCWAAVGDDVAHAPGFGRWAGRLSRDVCGPLGGVEDDAPAPAPAPGGAVVSDGGGLAVGEERSSRDAVAAWVGWARPLVLGLGDGEEQWRRLAAGDLAALRLAARAADLSGLSKPMLVKEVADRLGGLTSRVEVLVYGTVDSAGDDELWDDLVERIKAP